MPTINGLRYLPSTCVLLNEVIKTIISIACAFKESKGLYPPGTPSSTRLRGLIRSLFAGDSWKLAIPAGLYTLQNTLQYVAVSNLDAATFQVTYQLKILTTAMFSVTLLGRSLSTRKWISLILLIVGVSIVQLPASVPEPVPKRFSDWHNLLGDIRSSANDAVTRFLPSSFGKEDTLLRPQMSRTLGLLAVLTSCALSGLAGVLFEKILKTSRRLATDAAPVSLWVRNSQLSFWSLFPALFLGIMAKDGAKVAEQGFFGGYNWVVWCVVGLQAGGGVLVSLVIKYADNIAKNFATSVSVVASCVVSVWAFDFKITWEVSPPPLAGTLDRISLCSCFGLCYQCFQRLFVLLTTISSSLLAHVWCFLQRGCTRSRTKQSHFCPWRRGAQKRPREAKRSAVLRHT